MIKDLVRILAVAAVATVMTACAGTNYSVSAGFGHQSLAIENGGEVSGWGAGATIGMVSRDGKQAIALCGNGGFYFGKNELDLVEAKLVTDLSGIPLEACSEIPLGN